MITAKNGEDVVKKFRTHSNAIYLLSLDVIMPRKNGKEIEKRYMMKSGNKDEIK